MGIDGERTQNGYVLACKAKSNESHVVDGDNPAQQALLGWITVGLKEFAHKGRSRHEWSGSSSVPRDLNRHGHHPDLVLAFCVREHLCKLEASPVAHDPSDLGPTDANVLEHAVIEGFEIALGAAEASLLAQCREEASDSRCEGLEYQRTGVTCQKCCAVIGGLGDGFLDGL